MNQDINFKEELMQTKENFWGRLCLRLSRLYLQIMTAAALCALLILPAMASANAAGNDMWTVAQNIIVDVYNHIAGISTALAGLMSAVAVIGVKLSGNQHKSDQAWDWLKRIWAAWAIINGIGAFIAYITPQFSGFNTLTP